MPREKKTVMVQVPADAKSKLERMSDETGLSQSQLVVMAVHSLLANYDLKGSHIFADLITKKE